MQKMSPYALASPWQSINSVSFFFIVKSWHGENFPFFASDIFSSNWDSFNSRSDAKLVAKKQKPNIIARTVKNECAANTRIIDWIKTDAKYPIGVFQSNQNLQIVLGWKINIELSESISEFHLLSFEFVSYVAGNICWNASLE